jgi:hypothetical protein
VSDVTIRAILDDRINTAYASNVAFEGGKAYKPASNTAYLSVRMASQTRDAVGAGTKGVLRWTGVYQVLCVSPAGGGMTPALTQRQAIFDLFPKGLSLTTADSQKVIVDEPPRPGPAYADERWVYATALIPWHSDAYPT